MRASAVAPWGLVVLAFALALVATLASGCEDTAGARGRRIPGEDDPRVRVDSGVFGSDSGTATTASGPDGGKDSGAETDSGGGGAGDAGLAFFDARSPDDGGAGSRDIGGGDTGLGSGDTGLGTGDTGLGSGDTGFRDAAPSPDAAPTFPDAAVAGGGEVWIEIDYSNANTSRSPTFRYSNTPGWGAAQWAAVNANWPEAWDRFNNMSVVNDPIGRSLEIGGGSELQLMLGFEELISYSRASVRVEGRSRATSSRVDFDVYNPWNSCGISGATFGQQWQVQVVDVDLSQCFVIGQGVQAVRVDPTNGTVALVRLRLTLYDAVY